MFQGKFQLILEFNASVEEEDRKSCKDSRLADAGSYVYGK